MRARKFKQRIDVKNTNRSKINKIKKSLRTAINNTKTYRYLNNISINWFRDKVEKKTYKTARIFGVIEIKKDISKGLSKKKILCEFFLCVILFLFS